MQPSCYAICLNVRSRRHDKFYILYSDYAEQLYDIFNATFTL